MLVEEGNLTLQYRRVGQLEQHHAGSALPASGHLSHRSRNSASVPDGPTHWWSFVHLCCGVTTSSGAWGKRPLCGNQLPRDDSPQVGQIHSGRLPCATRQSWREGGAPMCR